MPMTLPRLPVKISQRLQGLQPRIVLFFVVLLTLVQGIALALVSAANLQISHAQLDKDLKIGERVFSRLIEQNGRQLTQAAKVLASDFGFREAIATQDVGTVASALGNHGSRIAADLVMLSNLDNQLIASTLSTYPANRPYPFAALISEAEQAGSASAIRTVDGRLYQLVLVPVRAPLTIAWVTMGFAVDDKVAMDLQQQSSLQISFVGRTEQDAWQVYASTLNAQGRAELASFLPKPDQPLGMKLDIAGEELETRMMVLTEHAKMPVYAVLQRSITEALAPFHQLQGTLIVLGAISVIVCLFVSIVIARSIARPIQSLATAAVAIRDGHYDYPVQTGQGGEIGELALSFEHMQEAIGQRERQILTLAYEDSLTSLPNRALFNDRFEQAIRAAKRTQTSISVLFMDMDRFKVVNDTLGHYIGDMLLVEVGARLKSLLRASDTVARLGGDEFAILLPDTTSTDCLPLVRKIQQSLREQVILEGQPVDVAVSIGIAGFPEHGTEASTLMSEADVAMYQAKRANTGYAIFDPAYHQFRQEDLSLLGDLRRAVDADELILYYQPKMDLLSNQVHQAEALVRWNHPERGFIPPNDFIPFAERTGYIKAVTRWVIARAIQQLGEWRTAGLEMKVSVNISTRDLLDPDLPDYVISRLSEVNVPPQQLCLEITESGFMEDPTHALDILRRLSALGLPLSIDDYGTGYSSLAYLKELPVSELKIDRSFIMHMATNKGDEMIVRSTIDLGHNMGLSVVAEGIDDEAILQLLRELGCDIAQGYLISRPLGAEAFVDWLKARTVEPA